MKLNLQGKTEFPNQDDKEVEMWGRRIWIPACTSRL